MKKVAFVLILILLALGSSACLGSRTPVSVNFVTAPPEVFDVDESFPEDLRGVIGYDDGSTEIFVIKQENIEDFSTTTTGEKRAQLVVDGVKKTFSYVVEYLPQPTKEILTDARLSVLETASLNGSSCVLALDCGQLNKVDAVSFTVECTRAFGATLEITPEIEGWDVRIREYTASAKVVAFRRGGEPLAGTEEFLRIATVGYADAAFSCKDVVVTDGERDYDLPNTK